MHISRNKRIAVTVVAVAAIPVTALSLQPTNAASSSSAPETFRLVERPGTFKFVDVPPRQQSEESPPTAGDQLIFTSPLFRSGERAGKLHAVCTITRRTQTWDRIQASCVGTFDLRAGSIQLAVGGRIFEDRLEIAVTGGTGRYAGANGTVTSVTRGNRTVDTVRLLG